MIQHPRQNSAEFGLTSSSIIDNPEGSSNISIDQKINSEHLPINRPHISKSIFRYRQLHYRALDHAMLRYSLLARYCLINPIKIGVTVAGFREWRFERTSLFRRNFSLKKTEEKRHVQKSDSSEVFASRLLSSTHQSRYYFNVKHVINFPPLFRRFFSRSSTKRIKGSRLEHFQALQSFSTLPFPLSFYFFFLSQYACWKRYYEIFASFDPYTNESTMKVHSCATKERLHDLPVFMPPFWRPNKFQGCVVAEGFWGNLCTFEFRD